MQGRLEVGVWKFILLPSGKLAIEGAPLVRLLEMISY